LVAAFALLGVAFYTLLIPGHLVSKFDATLFAAQYGISAEAICGLAAGEHRVPGAPATDCPICKGLVAFHLAIAPTAQPVLAPPIVPAASYDPLREDLTGRIALTPRNRGPPSLLV
jgi:hypothetical protein